MIVQWITIPTCLERQRRNYHKCFTCAHRGVGAPVVVAAKPVLPRRERPPLIP